MSKATRAHYPILEAKPVGAYLVGPDMVRQKSPGTASFSVKQGTAPVNDGSNGRALARAKRERVKFGPHAADAMDAHIQVKIDPSTNAKFYFNTLTKKSGWHLHEVSDAHAALSRCFCRVFSWYAY